MDRVLEYSTRVHYAVLPLFVYFYFFLFFGIQFSPCLSPGLDFSEVWIVCMIDNPPLSSTLLSCARSTEPFLYPPSSLVSFCRQVFFVHLLSTNNYYTRLLYHSPPNKIKTGIEITYSPPTLIRIDREREKEREGEGVRERDEKERAGKKK